MTDLLAFTAMLETAFAPGTLDQDAAHRLGGGREEVTAAVPVLVCTTAYQPQISLVNEGRGIQRLTRLFLGQFARRQAPQFVVHERQQLLGGVRVALFNGGENDGNLIHRLARAKQA